MRLRIPSTPLMATLVLGLVLPAAAGLAAAGVEIDNPVVFVRQRPVRYTFATIAGIFGNFTSYDPADGQPVGGGLYRLDPDGEITELVGGPRVAVRDPEISYDGRTVIFAMKRGARKSWQIWTVPVAGGEPRRVSQARRHDDWDPAFMPNGRILFVSDRLHWSDGYENLPEGQVFTMAADGRDVRPLAVNPNGDFNPLVAADGSVYFTQWDFADCRDDIDQDNCELDVNRFLLWRVNPDGSREGHPAFGMHTLYDFSGGYVQVRENPVRPGTFFGTLADEFFTFGAGSLVEMVPRKRGDNDRPRFVTADVFMSGPDNTEGRWRDPYPMVDGRLLASWAPGPVFTTGNDVPDFDLVVVDADSGDTRTLLSDPDAWLLQPVEVVSRTAPPVIDGDAAAGFDYAILNAKDVTLRGRNCDRVLNGDCQPRLRPGEAHRVRFYAVDRQPNAYPEFRGYADPRRRLLGEAPVRDDGSFAVALPPWTPVIWELLDGSGEVVVRERFWSELAPGEARTCDGCHAPHRPRPFTRTNSALRDVTNLSGQRIDADADGLADLLEALGLVEP